MKKFMLKLKKLFWGDEKSPNRSPLYIFMVVLSVVALISSNVIANKSFNVFGISINGSPLILTCGVLVFPVTYILSDLFSEVYGYSASRRTDWIGFGSYVFFLLFICLTILIPGANYYYEDIVSNGLVNGLGLDFLKGGNNFGSLGILFASLTAFVAGSFVNDLVFEKIKKRNPGDSSSKFVFRAIVSSLVGELVDSFIFIPLLYLFTNAFGTTITNFWQLIAIIIFQASMKVLYELLISPLTVILAKKLKKYEEKRKDLK